MRGVGWLRMARGATRVGEPVGASRGERLISVGGGGDGGIGKRFVYICAVGLGGLLILYILQNNRTRESSVAISPQWSMLEEIEFHRLAKLRLEVDEPEEL